MLKQRTYNEFIIKELTIGQFLPVMDKMGSQTQTAQLEMMGLSVCDAAGEPLGLDGVSALGASEFLPLWTAVADLHGLGEKKAESEATTT